MANLEYRQTYTVTNMQIIITKIGCRIGQSCKIRRNVLVRTGVWEPSRGRNRTNNKMGRGLVTTAAKLSTLQCCVDKEEAQLTLDVLLKRSVRRPLSTSNRPSGLLAMTMLPVHGGRGMRAMKNQTCHGCCTYCCWSASRRGNDLYYGQNWSWSAVVQDEQRAAKMVQAAEVDLQPKREEKTYAETHE